MGVGEDGARMGGARHSHLDATLGRAAALAAGTSAAEAMSTARRDAKWSAPQMDREDAGTKKCQKIHKMSPL